MSRNAGSNRPSLGKEVKLDCSDITSQVNFLQGKVLTIIEASISDERKLKAVKDLIKSAFSNQLAYIGDLCFPECGIATRESIESMGVDVDKMESDGSIEV